MLSGAKWIIEVRWVTNGDCPTVGSAAKGLVVLPIATETKGKKVDPSAIKFG